MKTGNSRLAVVSGWLLTLAYLAHQFVSIRLPRAPKVSALREDLRNWHYFVGSLLFAFVAARLWAWWRDRAAPPPPTRLSPAAATWAQTLALASYVLLLIAPVLGLLYGWSDGFALRAFAIPLPNLVAENRELWMFSGYFHSGLGFMLLLLNFATMVTAGYFALRYDSGLIRGFPPGYGAFAFIGVTLSVYAFATFRSPEPGLRAVAVFWIACAIVAGLGWAIHRHRSNTEAQPAAADPAWARVAAPLAVAAIVVAGAYGPYALFRVSPWPSTPVVAGGPRAKAMEVALPPETGYERTVGAETFKWCRFCHTLKQGEKALVGPNLYWLWGQRAGTSPGFAYSAGMAKARDRGLVWDDRTIAAYIHDPDGYIPGTTMVISSGPVTDPRKRQAVINILKRETMRD